MQCREFREIADSYLGEELLVETNHEVLRHLDTCAACRAELAERRELRNRVKAAFAADSSLQPHNEFVARLSSELRHTARQRVWRRPWWRLGALAAGLVALLAAGGLAWRASAERSRLTIDPVTQERAVRQIARDAAGDHRDCALHFRLSESPISLEDASHRYGDVYRALASAIAPGRDDAQEPFEVVESHSCVYKGRRVAHIVLRSRGKLVSIVVAERGPASVTTGNRVQTAGTGGVVSLRAVDGFSNAFFTAPHHIVFVVSALKEYENLAVAKAVAPSLARSLAES
jgi:anti-sigma factor RsiW